MTSYPTSTGLLSKVDALDRTISRMQGMLDLGRWPSGLELTDEDRRLISWNLEVARRERAERRAR
jgi:uncharacterized protein YeaC (DUF1315 family)